MFHISSLLKYQKKHPNYFGIFLKEIIRVWWWRINNQPIVVLTTESGGLGDYLWFRSYYSAVREHYAPEQCRIIVIGMCQWEPLVYGLDKDCTKNHFDIYRSFESPDNPLKIESLFFKLFKADVYVNFRAINLKHLVNAKEKYFGMGFHETKQFYETTNNSVFSQWFPLPVSFTHTPPLITISDAKREEALRKPYVVVVEGGNTQGKMSWQQIRTIIELIISQGYNIIFNGDYQKLISTINCQVSTINSSIIDGYSYPLPEYPTIVAHSKYVVTVNSFIYHLAIQLEKPCVVISVNEYESIKLEAANQVIIFNKELQQAFANNTLDSYRPIPHIRLQDIECKRIECAINEINTIINTKKRIP